MKRKLYKSLCAVACARARVFYNSLLGGRMMQTESNYLSQRETGNFHQGGNWEDF